MPTPVSLSFRHYPRVSDGVDDAAPSLCGVVLERYRSVPWFSIQMMMAHSPWPPWIEAIAILTIECEYVFIFSFQSQWSPEIFLLPFPRPHVCSFSVCHVNATYMSLLLRSSYYSSSSTAETPTGDGSGVFGLRLESVFLHTSRSSSPLAMSSSLHLLHANRTELCRRPWRGYTCFISSDMICIMKR